MKAEKFCENLDEKVTKLRQESWALIGFSTLIVALLIAWRMALKIGSETKILQRNFPAHRNEGKTLKVKGGQLVAEIPERREKWTLQFVSSHYDTSERVATTQNGICQVTRDGKVVTIFRAPTIVVRFKEREMEMQGGVTIVAMLAKLKANLKALKWNWETGQLAGTGQVKIEGEKFNASADQLEGETTMMQFSLKGDAKLDWSSKSGD